MPPLLHLLRTYTSRYIPFFPLSIHTNADSPSRSPSASCSTNTSNSAPASANTTSHLASSNASQPANSCRPSTARISTACNTPCSPRAGRQSWICGMPWWLMIKGRISCHRGLRLGLMEVAEERMGRGGIIEKEGDEILVYSIRKGMRLIWMQYGPCRPETQGLTLPMSTHFR
jgi:hypothetical protein